MKTPASPLLLTTAMGAVLIAGCASNAVDAQWTDTQRTPHPLRGARVLVVCEAPEVVLSRICVDRLTADLQARGASVVTPSDADAAPTAPNSVPPGDARYLPLARAAGASAVLATSITRDGLATDSRSSGFSIGIGGFGLGRRSAIGGGVEVPIGGSTTTSPVYAADARVTDTASGRLLWAARAGSPPAGDVRGQLDNLLQRLAKAAEDSQLF